MLFVCVFVFIEGFLKMSLLLVLFVDAFIFMEIFKRGIIVVLFFNVVDSGALRGYNITKYFTC